MAEVFIAPTGALDPRSLRDLRKAGVIVVETTEPERCSFIRATELVTADDMLWAALDALATEGEGYNGARDQRQKLAFNLADIVRARRRKDGT